MHHEVTPSPQLLVAALLCASIDALLFILLTRRLKRSRRDGTSLRLRIFGALAMATLTGALLTGIYVVAEEAWLTGVWPVLARIAPKAFVVGSVLLWLSAAGAAAVGRIMARSIEEITAAAMHIAEGELNTNIPKGHGLEARRLSKALTSMRRELEGRPYAAAFLRDAWHDLKTPVAAIKATVELLGDGAMEDPDAVTHFLHNLQRSSDQLERTIADLVTLSRFETSTLAPEELGSLAALTREVFASVQPIAEARQVDLQLHIEGSRSEDEQRGRLRGDLAALRRALLNLLNNAVHATEKGRVTVVLDDHDPARVLLDIVNEPAAVPPEVRDRLFERAATSRRGSSSGLGLAIARAAIEAHGGRVRFVDLGPPSVRVRLDLPR